MLFPCLESGHVVLKAELALQVGGFGSAFPSLAELSLPPVDCLNLEDGLLPVMEFNRFGLLEFDILDHVVPGFPDVGLVLLRPENIDKNSSVVDFLGLNDERFELVDLLLDLAFHVPLAVLDLLPGEVLPSVEAVTVVDSVEPGLAAEEQSMPSLCIQIISVRLIHSVKPFFEQ